MCIRDRPTPANYTQRAGRAGRSKNSVAYSLTFCRLSSHDLTYFNTPDVYKRQTYYKLCNVRVLIAKT